MTLAEKVEGRTGQYASMRLELLDALKVGGSDFESHIWESLHTDVGRAVAQAMSDGREYVVQFRVSVEQLDDHQLSALGTAREFRVTALVRLRKPDEAEIGDLVHTDAFSAHAQDKTVFYAGKEFRRQAGGWVRVR